MSTCISGSGPEALRRTNVAVAIAVKRRAPRTSGAPSEWRANASQQILTNGARTETGTGGEGTQTNPVRLVRSARQVSPFGSYCLDAA
jgi:hypothetical protein